jgi:hypothetical protein
MTQHRSGSTLVESEIAKRTTFIVPQQRDRFDGWGPRVRA